VRRAFGWILGLTVCLALVAVVLAGLLVHGLRDVSSARSGQLEKFCWPMSCGRARGRRGAVRRHDRAGRAVVRHEGLDEVLPIGQPVGGVELAHPSGSGCPIDTRSATGSLTRSPRWMRPGQRPRSPSGTRWEVRRPARGSPVGRGLPRGGRTPPRPRVAPRRQAARSATTRLGSWAIAAASGRADDCCAALPWARLRLGPAALTGSPGCRSDSATHLRGLASVAGCVPGSPGQLHAGPGDGSGGEGGSPLVPVAAGAHVAGVELGNQGRVGGDLVPGHVA
jgi:hypothetical protein